MATTPTKQETIEWLERLKSSLDQREGTREVFSQTYIEDRTGPVLRLVLRNRDLDRVLLENAVNPYRYVQKKSIGVYARFRLKDVEDHTGKMIFERRLNQVNVEFGQGRFEVQRRKGDEYDVKETWRESDNLSLVARRGIRQNESEQEQHQWLIEAALAMPDVLIPFAGIWR